MFNHFRMIDKNSSTVKTSDEEFLSRYPLIKSVKQNSSTRKSSTSDCTRKEEIHSLPKYGRVHPYVVLPPKLNPAPLLTMFHQPGQYPVMENRVIDEVDSPAGKRETVFPSYTAMIAQAILSTEQRKATLGGIYEFIEHRFRGLEKRVKGWRNCVRHNLSLNECFIKLGRSDSGRGNDWAIHPNYLQSFLRGEYRKRRACMKARNGFPWTALEYLAYTRSFPVADRIWYSAPYASNFKAASPRSVTPPSPSKSNYGDKMAPSPTSCNCGQSCCDRYDVVDLNAF